MIYHIQKDSWSLDDQSPSKKFYFSNFSLVREACYPDRTGPPLWISVISDKLYFFLQNEIILRGKNHTALFQTYHWEKSSFFNAPVHVFEQIYTNTWQGGGPICIPSRANRVEMQSTNNDFFPDCRPWLQACWPEALPSEVRQYISVVQRQSNQGCFVRGG